MSRRFPTSGECYTQGVTLSVLYEDVIVTGTNRRTNEDLLKTTLYYSHYEVEHKIFVHKIFVRSPISTLTHSCLV